MNINQIRSMYFLGIGGIGMSALARYFHSRGVSVSGYDRTPTPLTRQLQMEGMDIHFEEDVSLLPKNMEMVVYTPAIPANNKLLTHFISSRVAMKKRAEVLGMIGADIPTIAIAGTHGKTTICCMLAHIFMTANMPFEALMGGIATNYNTNYLSIEGAQWLVVEADEYDRSFLQLKPEMAVVTSIDADHLDIYGSAGKLRESFTQFANQIKDQGILLIKDGLDIDAPENVTLYTYDLKEKADFHATAYVIEAGNYYAGISGKLQTNTFLMGLPGWHNLENAIAAAALANFAGVPPADIQRALSSFKGVKRRFEACYKDSHTIYIDDYAHHPREIMACISTAKELYPGKKITGIFQPHLYSRTRDLAAGFADSLSLLDELIMLDIYPARELPIKGIDADWLLQQIPHHNKALIKAEDLIGFLEAKNLEVLLTMGAGDIDKMVAGITQMLRKKNKVI